MQTTTGPGIAETEHIPPMSNAPDGFSIERDLPAGFAAFYRPLHDAFTARQQAAVAARRRGFEVVERKIKAGVSQWAVLSPTPGS